MLCQAVQANLAKGMQHVSICFLSCRLRLATRKEVEEVELQKTKTAESKAEADLTSLQLQNLLYEKNYYNKEIATCRSFE